MLVSSQKRRSKYADYDENFVYDSTREYTNEDFKLLSINKVRDIARLIGIHNISSTKKEQLVPAVVSHHNVRRTIAQRRIQEEEETKESLEQDVLKFSDEMKLKFNRIKHYKYKGHVYFQANDIANFLEYEIPRKAIIDNVNQEDKVKFTEIHMNSSCEILNAPISINESNQYILENSQNVSMAGKHQHQNLLDNSQNDSIAPNKYYPTILHPDTMFINKYGIFDLITKSRMPLARQFRKWLVDEVLPMILETGSYDSSSLTRQINELKEKVHQIEEENQNLKLTVCDNNKTDEVNELSPIMLNSYDGEKVVYLFCLKEYNALKFGRSEDLRERAMSHCNAYGKNPGDVILVHVIVTDYAMKIEQEIKDQCKSKGWRRLDISINGRLQKEIIDLNKTTIQSVIDLMNTVAQKYNESIKKKENSIVSKSIEFKREVTKQVEAKTRIAESESKARIAESEAKARIAESEARASEARARIAESEAKREMILFKKMKLELQMNK